MKTLPKEYEEVVKLIRYNAARIHKNYGGAAGELADLIGEANLAYCEACQTYDATRGTTFETWLRTKIANRLLQDIRSKVRRASLLHRVTFRPEVVAAPGGGVWDMDGFLDSLSDSALEAVAIAGEVSGGSESDYQKRVAVLKRLRATRWSRGKIEIVFEEVRQALRESRR